MTPTIPRDRPSLAFEVAVPEPWYESYARPVLSPGGDLVLLSGGWDQYAVAADHPALVAVDAATGAVRFTHRIRTLRPGMTECQIGLPVARGGRIGVAIYQWDVSVAVHWLDEQGALVREDDLAAGRESELDVRAADSGIKLWLQPLGLAGDSYVASWIYRVVRASHLQCRAIRDGALRWEAKGRLVGLSDDLLLLETDPPRPQRRELGAAIVAHALSDGGQRWQLPPVPVRQQRVRSPVGIDGDTFVFIDRSRRGDALAAREMGVLELAVAEDSEDWARLEDLWDRDHPLPGDEVVALDVASGTERWRHALPASAHSVVCARDGVWVVADAPASASDRRATLCRLGGATAVSRPLPLGASTVVAADGELLLLANERELAAVTSDERAALRWRIDLPADVRAEGPVVSDRLLGAAAVTLGDGCIYLRRDDRLWCLRGSGV